jgi:HlyD family secretion protein
VTDGSHVAAGDLLVKLDETQARALLGIVTSQLTELVGRKARLAAERDDRDDLEFPPGFTQGGPEEERVASGERRLFQARLASANGQKAQLEERIKQNEEEIKGLTLQNTAKARELALIAEELSRVDELYKKKLLPVTRVLSLQRDEVHIEGEVGTLVAQIAKLGGQIAETRLQILTVDQTRFSDAQKELREVEGRIASRTALLVSHWWVVSALAIRGGRLTAAQMKGTRIRTRLMALQLFITESSRIIANCVVS